jgi:hypothetical protein
MGWVSGCRECELQGKGLSVIFSSFFNLLLPVYQIYFEVTTGISNKWKASLSTGDVS